MIRKKIHWFAFCCAISTFYFSIFSWPALGVLRRSPSQNKPKLVLLLVIDQLRSDQLSRFENLFLPHEGSGKKRGGFRYLTHQGAYFPFAQYEISQSMTGPGHATLLTGSFPYQNGMPTHVWYEHNRQTVSYCVSDPAHQTVGGIPSKPPKIGTSPKNLIGTTVGDELKNAGYASRVVSIALKDRAAILMGGHRADLALWFSTKSFAWVTSDYYVSNQKLPRWVTQLNQELEQQKGKKTTWSLKGAGSGLSLLDSLALKNDQNAGLIGEGGFPYTFEVGSKASLLHRYGVEMTELAAERAIQFYGLGKGKAPDLLAVSFSTHDYIGHAFGPNSREIEELMVDEDQVISKLLNYLDRAIPGGLKTVLVIFTADHGAAPNPDWLKTVRIDAGRISEDKIVKEIEKHLTTQFGSPAAGGKWVHLAEDFQIFLNHQAISEKKLSRAVVETEVKSIVQKTPGVAFVVTSTEYGERKLPPGLVGRQFLNTYYPGRSGDVVLIPKPFYIDEGYTASHITGYSFDRFVPLILMGPGIRAKRFAQQVGLVDIAPTLSYLLGITPPALSEGKVLAEALVE